MFTSRLSAKLILWNQTKEKDITFTKYFCFCNLIIFFVFPGMLSSHHEFISLHILRFNLNRQFVGNTVINIRPHFAWETESPDLYEIFRHEVICLRKTAVIFLNIYDDFKINCCVWREKNVCFDFSVWFVIVNVTLGYIEWQTVSRCFGTFQKEMYATFSCTIYLISISAIHFPGGIMFSFDFQGEWKIFICKLNVNSKQAIPTRIFSCGNRNP